MLNKPTMFLSDQIQTILFLVSAWDDTDFQNYLFLRKNSQNQRLSVQGGAP